MLEKIEHVGTDLAEHLVEVRRSLKMPSLQYATVTQTKVGGEVVVRLDRAVSNRGPCGTDCPERLVENQQVFLCSIFISLTFC
jgi:hypothetical protein